MPDMYYVSLWVMPYHGYDINLHSAQKPPLGPVVIFRIWSIDALKSVIALDPEQSLRSSRGISSRLVSRS